MPELMKREDSPAVTNNVTPMGMLQLAVERGADIEQLTKLMDLQERWEKNEARKAFVSAMAAFKSDPPTLTKNKRVSFGKTEYDHATLDQVASVIAAALSKHGFSHRWEVEHVDGGMIRVTCVITHTLGHSEKVSMQAGADQSGGKNNIQAVGSTVSYLERYTLLAGTGLAAKDQDDDGLSGNAEFITQDQAANIEAMITEVKADKEKFLSGYMHVDAVEHILSNEYKKAITALEAKRRRSA